MEKEGRRKKREEEVRIRRRRKGEPIPGCLTWGKKASLV